MCKFCVSPLVFCAFPRIQCKPTSLMSSLMSSKIRILDRASRAAHTHARAHTHVCAVLALPGGDVFLFILPSNNIYPRAFEFKDRFPALKKDTTQRVECASPFCFHDYCTEMRTGVHGMMQKWGWGPAASTLKGILVRTQHVRF